MPAAPSLSVIWHENYEVDIGPHVFPTRKYRAVRDRALSEGAIREGSIRAPEPATDEQVGLVHTPEYLRKMREGDFSARDELILEIPFSRALKDAMWLCAGGSILTAELSLESGVAVHIGGGFHHAFPDHGEGFCLINDVAIAVRALTREGAIRRAAVLDCDLHHGNGTAAIFADDPSVFTFSIHQQNNYPAVKPPGDLDLGLPDGTADDAYLGLLREHVPGILDEQAPELAVYLAGADPYREDQLGGLKLSMEGLRERDEMILGSLREREIPAAVVLAGGYARRFEDTVAIHFRTLEVAAELLR